jgi:hypothetical protein
MLKSRIFDPVVSAYKAAEPAMRKPFHDRYPAGILGKAEDSILGAARFEFPNSSSIALASMQAEGDWRGRKK